MNRFIILWLLSLALINETLPMASQKKAFQEAEAVQPHEKMN